MTQNFTIGGDRKLDIAVTVGVKDVETLDGLRWPWGVAFWTLLGVFGLACLLTALSGLPYLQTGATYCSSGTADQPCGAPVDCVYAGWQGHRSLRIEDAGSCPSVLFLPWHVEPLPRAQPPRSLPPDASPKKKSRRRASAPEYGPAGPPIDGY